jgi:hypothetical protein
MSTDKNTSARFETAAEAAIEPSTPPCNVFPPEAPPPPGASEELLDLVRYWRQGDREVFANALETARVVYAFRPDLVTAPHWPADVKVAFMASGNLGDYDPDVEQHLCIGEHSFAPDYEEWVLSQAEKTMRELEAKKAEEARQHRVVCIDRGSQIETDAPQSEHPVKVQLNKFTSIMKDVGEALTMIGESSHRQAGQLARIEKQLGRKTGSTKKRGAK